MDIPHKASVLSHRHCTGLPRFVPDAPLTRCREKKETAGPFKETRNSCRRALCCVIVVAVVVVIANASFPRRSADFVVRVCVCVGDTRVYTRADYHRVLKFIMRLINHSMLATYVCVCVTIHRDDCAIVCNISCDLLTSRRIKT